MEVDPMGWEEEWGTAVTPTLLQPISKAVACCDATFWVAVMAQLHRRHLTHIESTELVAGTSGSGQAGCLANEKRTYFVRNSLNPSKKLH